jgi:cytochrome bd-type quinol oxidase subunit 2
MSSKEETLHNILIFCIILLIILIIYARFRLHKLRESGKYQIEFVISSFAVRTYVLKFKNIMSRLRKNSHFAQKLKK